MFDHIPVIDSWGNRIGTFIPNDGEGCLVLLAGVILLVILTLSAIINVIINVIIPNLPVLLVVLAVVALAVNIFKPMKLPKEEVEREKTPEEKAKEVVKNRRYDWIIVGILVGLPIVIIGLFYLIGISNLHY